MQTLPLFAISSLPWRELPTINSSFFPHNTVNSSRTKRALRITARAVSDAYGKTIIGDNTEGEDGSIEYESGKDGDDSGEFSSRYRVRGRKEEEEKDYDRNPEIADIMGSFMEDPQKAQSRVEERIRKKRDKILQTKSGSSNPMKVTFRKFKFSNSYIWYEFYHPPLTKDIELLCDVIRSWHIVGRLGGCNSMNMQLSQSPLDQRPVYDAIEGANVTPTTFYNIGDLEIQENLARMWVDIGTTETLLLDVLINALTNISSDYVGIKQVVFGGQEFEDWKEGLSPDDSGGRGEITANSAHILPTITFTNCIALCFLKVHFFSFVFLPRMIRVDPKNC